MDNNNNRNNPDNSANQGGFYDPQQNNGQNGWNGPQGGWQGAPQYMNPQYAPRYGRPRGRLRVDTDGKDEIFSAVFLFFSIVASWLVFWGNFRSGFTVANWLLLILATIYAAGNGASNKDRIFPVICGLGSLAVSAMPTFRYDRTLIVVIVAATVCLDAVYFYGLFGTPKRGYKDLTMLADVCNRTFAQPIKNIAVPWRSMSAKNTDPKKPHSKNFGKIIAGVFIAVPLVIVLAILLSNSDAAFESMMKNVLSGSRTLLGVIIVGFLCYPFVFSYVFSLRKRLDSNGNMPSKTQDSFRFCDITVVNTVLGIVSVLYGVYLFAQLSYFFNGFSGMLPDGYSYAQYARRGFFELCVISGINLVLVFFALALTKLRTDGKPSGLVRGFALYICIFTLITIGTALSKMYMYIGEYGMTRRRILTSCFMVFIAVCFVAAIIRVFARKFPYMKLLICAAAVMLVTVSAKDIDTVIADYNIDAYTSGQINELDVYELEELGPGATPKIASMLDCGDSAMKLAASKLLCVRAQKYYDIDFSDYSYKPTQRYMGLNSFTLDEYREYKVIASCIDKLDFESGLGTTSVTDTSAITDMSAETGRFCYADVMCTRCDKVYIVDGRYGNSFDSVRKKYALSFDDPTSNSYFYDTDYVYLMLFSKGELIQTIEYYYGDIKFANGIDCFDFDTVFSVKTRESSPYLIMTAQ